MPTTGPTMIQTLGLELINYGPFLLLILMAVTFAVANVVASLVIGPSRAGSVKGSTYESGMVPIGTARKRFNVRFYIIAMTFLVFDVEIVFLYPWAVTYSNIDPDSVYHSVFWGRILFFMLTTVVAYVYGYRKGVFRFD